MGEEAGMPSAAGKRRALASPHVVTASPAAGMPLQLCPAGWGPPPAAQRTLKAGSGPTRRSVRSSSSSARSTSFLGALACSEDSTGGRAWARKRLRVASTSGEAGGGSTSSTEGPAASSSTAQVGRECRREGNPSGG